MGACKNPTTDDRHTDNAKDIEPSTDGVAAHVASVTQFGQDLTNAALLKGTPKPASFAAMPLDRWIGYFDDDLEEWAVTEALGAKGGNPEVTFNQCNFLYWLHAANIEPFVTNGPFFRSKYSA
jgi:hypothetical protein